MHTIARAAALGVLAMLAACAAPACAPADWGPPTILHHFVDVAAGNARGEQAFMWSVGTSDSVQIGGSPYGVLLPHVVMRGADGRLTRSQVLPSTRRIVARGEAIGLDGRGAATAVWTRTTASGLRILVSRRPPGGRFDSGSEIGAIRRQGDNQFRLAVAPDGAAVLLWTDGEHVYAAQRPAGRCARGAPRACFARTQDLRPGRCPPGIRDCLEFTNLVLAVGPRGRVFAAWTSVLRTYNGYRTLVRLAVARPGARFQRAIGLSSSDVADAPQLARTRDGGAIVVWTRGRSMRDQRVVAMRVDSDGEPHLPPRAISPATCIAEPIRVNRSDEVIIPWICEHDSSLDKITIGAAYGPARSLDLTTVDLGRRDYGSRDGLGLDAAGNAILVYSPDGTTTVTGVRPPLGPFGAPFVVPDPEGEPISVGGQLIEAGNRLTLLRASTPTSSLRDWRPQP